MKKTGFVYILCDDHSKHVVKIGKASKDVEKRVRTLQTGNPWIREFITVESSKWNEIEKAVHHIIRTIAHNKQVGTSEFFRIEPEEAKKILLEFGKVLPKNDFKVVEHKKAISRAKLGRAITAANNNKNNGQIVFQMTRCGADAEGCWEKDHSFTVFRGSRVASKIVPSFKVHCKRAFNLYKDLLKAGIIVDGLFKKDYRFASCSLAASVCGLCSLNGYTAWTCGDSALGQFSK